jgi:hypothetical protein
MGSQTQNLNSYSSIRQTVTVPAEYSRTYVSFWGYTWSDSAPGGLVPGGDAQEFVLLGPGNVVWAVPWKVLEDTQVWQQHLYQLVGVAGQTFDLYFAAINNGKDGTAALYVDNVNLWACAGDASPFVTAAQLPAPAPAAEPAAAALEAQMVPVPQVYPVETLPALDLSSSEPLAGAAMEPISTTLPLPGWTEVAIATAPPLSVIGPGTPPATLIAAMTATPARAAGPLSELGTAIAGSSLFGSPVTGTPVAEVSTAPQPARFLGINTENWPANWRTILIVILILLVVVGVIIWLVRRNRNP